jgi:hypothetical protein
MLKKLNFTVLILCLFSCNFSENTTLSSNYDIINSDEGNWLVNIDSLKNIDNYIAEYRMLRKQSDSSIIPFIFTDSGQKINLRQIRKPKGSSYFWDCRSQFKIYVNSKNSYSCYWITGTSCNSENITEHINHFTSLKNLKNEIKSFYKTNTDLELSHGPTESELEVWIIPLDDDLINCKVIIENVAIAYQEFQKSNNNLKVPLSIVLSKNRPN